MTRRQAIRYRWQGVMVVLLVTMATGAFIFLGVGNVRRGEIVVLTIAGVLALAVAVWGFFAKPEPEDRREEVPNA